MNKELTKELEKILEKYTEESDSLNEQIVTLTIKKKDVDGKINDLKKAYLAATGKFYAEESKNRSLADLAEELLKEFKELHVDEMLRLIEERNLSGNRQIAKQSLVATLVRYSQQKNRFERVKKLPNTFTLKQ